MAFISCRVYVYLIFPGYFHYCDIYRRESGRCSTLPFSLTFFFYFTFPGFSFILTCCLQLIGIFFRWHEPNAFWIQKKYCQKSRCSIKKLNSSKKKLQQCRREKFKTKDITKIWIKRGYLSPMNSEDASGRITETFKHA